MGIVLFTILVTAGLAVLVRTTSVASQNLRRTTAANLLTRQIEAARGTKVLDIPNGRRTTTAVVGGTTYTITQDADYVSSADTTSLCVGATSSLLYKLVTVRVTWPEMQRVAPVRGDTLRAVGLGSDDADAARGALTVVVRDESGAVVPGATVRLDGSGESRTTGSDGCAVFVDVTPGSYTVDVRPPPGPTWAGQSGTGGGLQVTPGEVRRTTVVIHPPPPPPPPPSSTPSTGGGGTGGGGWTGGGGSDGGSSGGGSSGGGSSGGSSGGGGGSSSGPPPAPPKPKKAS